ncbi:Major facilitator superfamily domain, general substrate transporter [Moelleriella libera RCEF 2490]|uniref:Major facilitator superfamily domain, general substrate transporter n=1 Tax=Moelleriella libera RCEF 2490 TaxID=1081109 RepID=A0A166PCH4_9HYPO|nr:Major facilitator superfamily domain, general substrate transporter [Moelleriella libera RCEF 2490]
MPPDRRLVSASPAASSSAPSPPTPSEETPLLLAAARTTDLENGVPRTSASASSSPPSSLPSSASKSPSRGNKDTSSTTTLFPRNQIMLLCYARMTEPIAFFSIFPFIAAMVARNGSLPSSDVGLYSGVIESVFSLVQTLVLMPWSRLADRIGRKPALVLSLCGTAVCPALFGLATSIPQMLAFRCLAGLFSASGLIIRTMIAEKTTTTTTTTTTTNTISPSSSSSEEGHHHHHHHHHHQQQQQQQALAFSWFAFAGNVGILLGPIVGGALAEPALQYPRFFGRSRFLAAYPYALPGFAVAAVSASAAIVALVYLEETLPPAKTRCKPAATTTTTTTNNHPTNHNDNDNDNHHRGADAAAAAAAAAGQEEAPQIDSSNDSSSTHHGNASAEVAVAEAEAAAAMTTWQLIKAPGVAAALWIYSHVMFLAFAFTAILPVALYTPVDIGGLGLSSVQISAYMAAQGASQALWLLLAFPLLQRRLGTRGVLYACALVYPLFFVGYILMNLLLRDGSGPAMAWFWIIGPLVALVGPGVSMAFTGVQLALNDAAPAVHLLGTLNAIALTCTGAIRSVVPGAATALYAVGVRNQIVWGHLAWLILLPIAMALFFCLKWLRSST